jgi:NADH-ubiquinone oxidoreductase chain 5
MLFLIVLSPLFGYFSGSLFGFFLGTYSAYICTLSILVSLSLSLNIFYNVLANGAVYKLVLGDWVVVDSLNISWSFCFDSLTSVMLLVVTFISLLVHIYSMEYMESDPHLPRFMSYLSLFTFFMLILITSNNFLQMFVGWEGVGLSSYLLINFWFTRIQANKSAIKAMLVNRVGDFFILLGLFSIYYLFNSLDYDSVFIGNSLLLNYNINFLDFSVSLIDLICLLLFFGAMGKSAQLGLHTWLPDAMEGPTPVSALIHAATMVTAGVFLIIRCSFLFEYSTLALNLIMLIGSATAFFASTVGLFQNDIKKVIAYSTCSQLGYMTFACGLSGYDVGLFHLSNHAFFKALLFLSAGAVIHGISDEQDMRKMGGLKNLLPFSYSSFVVGSLALIGFPFFTGFYSKDTILEVAYSKFDVLGHFCYYLGTFAAFFTAFYSTRLIFLIFLSNANGNKNSIINAHEGGWKLSFPLGVLIIFSVVIGYLSKELFIGFGTNFWNGSIFILPQNYLLVDVEFISLFFKLLPLLLTLLGLFSAYFLYSFKLSQYFLLKKTSFFKIFYTFFNKKWYIDRVYNQYITQNLLKFGLVVSYQYLDRGILELFGPSGTINFIKSTYVFKSLQSGDILDYLYLSFYFLLFLLLGFIFF